MIPKLECGCLTIIELIQKTHSELHKPSLSLRRKLQLNRERMGTGSGISYWDSVMATIEKHDREEAEEV